MDIITGAHGKFRRIVIAGQLWERDDIDTLEEYVDICIKTGKPRVI